MAVKKNDGAEAGEKEEKSPEMTERKFSRDQILSSARYAGRRDLMSALLDAGRKYTKREVDELIDKFMKGKVK